MNTEQDMQFVDPDWRPTLEENTRPVGSQPISPAPIIDEQEYPALPERDKLTLSPEYFARKRFKRRAFSLGLLLAGVGVAGGGGWYIHQTVMSGQMSLPSTRSQQQQLTINGQQVSVTGRQPRIIVNSVAGDVNITGAPISEVVFQTRNAQYTPTAEGLRSVSYNLSYGGNWMTINVGSIPGGSSLKNIVLDLQVPNDAMLEVYTPYGIDVKDVDGQMVLTNTRDDAGMSAHGTLRGNSRLHATNNIFFFGSLDPHGTYYFECDNGPVSLFLPSDASFHLQVQADGAVTNSFHSNTVGKPPQAELTIITHNGLIDINKRP